MLELVSFKNVAVDIVAKVILLLYVLVRRIVYFLTRTDVGVSKEEYKYMDMAYQEAEKGLHTGNYPVGAVVVADDKVIAKAYSTSKSEHDERNHAECLAISEALEVLHIKNNFSECNKKVTIYTSSEPCPMCRGLMVYRGIDEVKYGEIHCHLGKIFGYKKNSLHLLLHTRGGIHAEKHYKIIEKYKQNKKG